jgi:ABC-2 type transport system permease protein
MFKEIFLFEFKSAFRKPATYIYFAVFFLITFFLGLTVAGVFDVSSSDSNQIVNSPYAVASILQGTGNLFGLLVSIMLISIVATVIQKDYQYNTHPFFFTKPISKGNYFFGRFLSVFLVSVLIISGLILGYYFGSLFGAGTPQMGPFKIMHYLQPFLLFTLPNLFVFAIIYFSLTTYTRGTMAAYIVALLLMVLQFMSGQIYSNIDNKQLAAILEPTGGNALQYITEYWTPQERNTKLIPFADEILYNRLLWMGLALGICTISFIRFRFSQFLEPFQIFKRRPKAETAIQPAMFTLADIPAVTQNYDAKARLAQLWWITKLELNKVIRSKFFIILCLLMVGMSILILNLREQLFSAATHLVTYQMVEILQVSIVLFLIIFIIFYTGTTIWREREVKMDEMVGTTPVSNAVLFFSKFTGILLATTLIYVVASLAGALIQFYLGVTNINFLQYFIFILSGIAIQVVFIAYCLSIQVYVGNKYFGFFLSLLPIIILPIVYSSLEWNLPLADFNSEGTSLTYSDLNGYGGAFTIWFFFRLYWFFIAGIFCVMALFLYARGKEKTIPARWKLSASNRKAFQKSMAAFALTGAIATGIFIYYQTRILVPYLSPEASQKLAADMEKKYRRYKDLIQPRITAVNFEADFFTKSRALKAKGFYLLKNQSQISIDTLYLEYSGGKKSAYFYPKFEPSVPFKVISDDKEFGVKIVQLQQPMQPGDSLQLFFSMEYKPRGLFDKSSSPILRNGTFINHSTLPSIGYQDANELSENAARKKYGLERKARMASIDDSLARKNNIFSNNADWIQFETTLSTDDGQIAVAPGYLQKDWKENGRHYYKYVMDRPMVNFYSMLSGNYQVLREKWNDVNIEIYYQKGHEYNLNRMMKGVKNSLNYYAENFGPYQHKQARIIEFPRTMGSFAQSFSNTISFSESIGFISKVDESPDAIDFPFYVTAHEMAHQWWGHQVAEAPVQGQGFLMESLSQYSALMVMEKEYGPDAMKKFLKDEMDKYLLGRTTEGKGELPLMLCENQQYIHYRKGSVVMYALKDFIGEDSLNSAIRKYLEANKFKGPLYANARELVANIKAVTPDSLQYAVTDMLEKITLYENYVKDLDFKELPDKTYKVTLTVGSVKYYADSVGRQSKAAVNDYMDIGIFTENTDKTKLKEKPIIFERIKMDKPEKTFTYIVKEKPYSAGLDPYLKLIDRKPANNSYLFGKKPAIPNLDDDMKKVKKREETKK